MSIELLTYGEQRFVTDLCHNVHPQPATQDDGNTHNQSQDHHTVKFWKIAGSDAVINCVFIKERCDQRKDGTYKHNQQYCNNLFFVGKQIGQKPQECF